MWPKKVACGCLLVLLLAGMVFAQTWTQLEIKQDGKVYLVPAFVAEPNEIPEPNNPPNPNDPVTAQWWVDAANGDDANPGTKNAPWQTVARAKIDYDGTPRVAYGDTVAVAPGAYGGFTMDKNAFPLWTEGYTIPLPEDQEWVRYVATAPGARLDGIRFSLGNDLRVVCHEFDGFEILQPQAQAVYTRCAMGLRLKNLTIRGIQDEAQLRAGTTTHDNLEFAYRNAEIHVEHCDIRYGYRGVFFGGWNCNVSVVDCNIFEVGTDKFISGGGVNMLLQGNLLHGNSLLSDQHPDCIQFYTAANRYEGASVDNLTIRGNRIYDHSSQGIWTGGSLLNNVIFENNLIYNTGNYDWRVYGVQGGVFRNNTIVGDAIGATGFIFYGGKFEDSDGLLEGYPRNSNIVCHHNVFATAYSGDRQVFTEHDNNFYVKWWDGSVGDDEPNSIGFDTIEAAAQALFVDPDARDYRLKAPYVGRGGYERKE